MQKVVIALLIIIIILIVLIKPTETIDNSDKLDSLRTELKYIKDKRDSVKERIDTVNIIIKENEKQYKEIVNTIISNDVNSDYVFFINYLQRFNNNNYTDSIKEY